jgi:hypothetical protein
MNLPIALNGWLWIKHGFQILKKRPFEIMFVFFGLMFIHLGLNLVPKLGGILSMFLSPALGMGFFLACRNAESDQLVTPGVLLSAFRSPAFKSLCVLGGVQIVAMLIAIGFTTMIDDGFLWDVIIGKKVLDEDALKNAQIVAEFAKNLATSMLWLTLFYLPATMVFWYSPALIAWHGMSVSKAAFYSFFAVWRSRLAFLVYFLSWGALVFLISLVLGSLVKLSPSIGSVVNTLSVPFLLLIVVAMKCSAYAGYSDVFQRDDTA